MDVEISCSFLPIDFKEKTILISKRSKFKKYFAGYWETIGGGLLDPEDLESCIRREVQEELGCTIIELMQFKTRLIYYENIKYINIAFIGTLGDIINIKETEIDKIQWIKESDIESYIFFPGNKDIILECFNYIKTKISNV